MWVNLGQCGSIWVNVGQSGSIGTTWGLGEHQVDSSIGRFDEGVAYRSSSDRATGVRWMLDEHLVRVRCVSDACQTGVRWVLGSLPVQFLSPRCGPVPAEGRVVDEGSEWEAGAYARREP